MSRRMLTLVAVLTALPAAAVAQTGQAQGQATAAAATETAQARIAAAMQAAASAEIPLSLLESKVQEGQAKQVPMERIALAVEARLQGLLRARDVLGRADATAVSEGELLVAAEALRAGVSENALIRVTREADGERRAVATAVLTDLVRLGYGNDNAFARVNAALSGGPEALVNLRAEAAANLRARGLFSTDITGGMKGGIRF